MPCYHPISAYRASDGSVVFSELSRFKPTGYLFLPCGQCIGCRLERSRQWAVRMTHEASLHDANCFLTLTYDDANLPGDRSLHYEHFQLFMKRLRRRFSSSVIRFYMCGEYGEDFHRPHYHACIFGFDFPDKVLFKKGEHPLYRSDILESLWPFGFCSIGSLTFESAAYCARYCLKKVTGDLSDGHYQFVDPSSGEVFAREPEFAHMSLKPGIGARWLADFASDVYSYDYVITRGHKSKAPRYYDRLRSKAVADFDETTGFARYLKSFVRGAADQTDDRLAVREQVAASRAAFFKRCL